MWSPSTLNSLFMCSPAAALLIFLLQPQLCGQFINIFLDFNIFHFINLQAMILNMIFLAWLSTLIVVIVLKALIIVFNNASMYFVKNNLFILNENVYFAWFRVKLYFTNQSRKF